MYSVTLVSHFHFRWEGGRGTRKSENTSTPSSNEAMATPRGAEQSTSVHQTRDTAARASERRCGPTLAYLVHETTYSTS